MLLLKEIDNLRAERKNLINICKLVIKDLIDTSLFPDNRTVENESIELNNFFVVLENIFNHGFKGEIKKQTQKQTFTSRFLLIIFRQTIVYTHIV